MIGPSAVYFVSEKGKCIMGRTYADDFNIPKAIERFSARVIEAEDAYIRPVFSDAHTIYVWIKVGSLYLVALSKRNLNVALTVSFLQKLVETMNAYFHGLDEETLYDNFVLAYELLDEMMDNGIPQTTDTGVLKEYIKTERFELLNKLLDKKPAKLPSAVTNAVSWRPEGIKYKVNEIYVDVIEKLNMIVAANGSVLKAEILGCIKMKAFLSGMPELKIGLNDKFSVEKSGGIGGSEPASGPMSASSKKSVALEDVRLHQCVRLNKFEADRMINFVPPDGEFELMSYRVSSQLKPLIFVETVMDRSTRSKIEIVAKVRANFKAKSIANNVEIRIPVPSDVDTPVLKASSGSVRYAAGEECLVWTVKHLAGGAEPVMTALFGLPSVESATRENFSKLPVTAKFEIPYFTASGLTVKYLKIVEKSGYQAVPWVRYITVNGNYQLRTV